MIVMLAGVWGTFGLLLVHVARKESGRHSES
jgi:hypothetical protein